MAVDWLGKNLYILDVELKQIIVCSLQRDSCALLSRNVSHGSLRSVAVDPAAGYNFSLSALPCTEQIIYCWGRAVRKLDYVQNTMYNVQKLLDDCLSNVRYK